MSLTLLLSLSGGLEAVGGILALIAPVLTIETLLGGPADVVAIVLTRFFGAGMFALGLTCLKVGDHVRSPAGSAVVYGITSYNIVASVLLIWAAVVIGGPGVLLLAAAVTHAGFGVLFLRALMVLAKKQS